MAGITSMGRAACSGAPPAPAQLSLDEALFYLATPERRADEVGDELPGEEDPPDQRPPLRPVEAAALAARGPIEEHEEAVQREEGEEVAGEAQARAHATL